MRARLYIKLSTELLQEIHTWTNEQFLDYLQKYYAIDKNRVHNIRYVVKNGVIMGRREVDDAIEVTIKHPVLDE